MVLVSVLLRCLPQKRLPRSAGFCLQDQYAGFWQTQLALAVVHAQLGEKDTAYKAVQELLLIRPDFPVVARDELAKWWQPELVEHLLEGLRKAGLKVPARLT
jgi:hypothetical protein